jgi:hypothetical protein
MFLDLDNLSVDELIQRQMEIRQKMTTAMNTGMSPAILGQMRNMLDQIDIEIKTKAQQERLDQERQQKIDNDEDPDSDNVLNIGEIGE